jgi:DGQHR domain-containing protein
MTTFKFTALKAKQSPGHLVLSFAAYPSEILQFAEIDRVNRGKEGSLTGFQRNQIAPHIKEIRDYLSKDHAILPNPIVVAFVGGVDIKEIEGNMVSLSINADNKKPGFVVDGQQRLTALSGLTDKDFQVFVSVLVCKDYDELRQQFVLINNTRPLPKALIYELLPSTPDLPERFTARAFASKLVELLNYDESSSLHGQLFQHTNPSGVIRDTAIQKIVMNSVSDGAMREFTEKPDFLEASFTLISSFFAAVQEVFPEAWKGHKPQTSRLIHGAGIVAMGYLMEFVYSRYNAKTKDDFIKYLQAISASCHWTSGVWSFSEVDQREWNKIQNVASDIMTLASYLINQAKRVEIL